MEPISAIALSLALGAGATAGTEIVKAVVMDAYDKLKELIRSRYSTTARRFFDSGACSSCSSETFTGFFYWGAHSGSTARAHPLEPNS